MYTYLVQLIIFLGLYPFWTKRGHGRLWLYQFTTSVMVCELRHWNQRIVVWCILEKHIYRKPAEVPKPVSLSVLSGYGYYPVQGSGNIAWKLLWKHRQTRAWQFCNRATHVGHTWCNSSFSMLKCSRPVASNLLCTSPPKNDQDWNSREV